MQRQFPDMPDYLVRPHRHLYVLQFEDGAVKVGRGMDARNRAVQIHCDAKRAGLPGVVRGVGFVTSRCNSVCEKELIARMTELGRLLPRKREYFTGVSFDVAAEIAGEIAKAEG